MNTIPQRIHNARTARAKNNLKELFSLSANYRLMLTEKEEQTLKDLNPGVYRILKDHKI